MRAPPLPVLASAEARAFLAQPIPEAVFRHAPQSPDEWRALIDRFNALRADAVETLRALLPVRIDTVTISGVPCRVLTPEGAPDAPDAPVVVEFHGGAYVLYAGLSGLGRALKFALASGLRVIAVDYRMPPAAPYPAALEDALAVYRAVLADKPARRVAVYGTSAGGNLAAAMMVAARAEGLAMPAAAVLNTPWMDLTGAGDSLGLFDGIDPALVTYHGLVRAAAALYADGLALDDPRLSPIHADLGGFPPAQIITGTRDLLLSDATRLHMRLLDLGRESELRVYEGMWHAFADIPEEAQVYDAMTRFLRARLG